jgi:hypothetical protein
MTDTKRDDNKSKRDDNTSKRDDNTSKRDDNTSKRDDNKSKRDDNTSKRDDNKSKRDDNTSKRAAIAEEQALLLQSLIEGCAPPDGFNGRRVRICGNSLRSKRLRTILRLHPWISQILGNTAKHEFDSFLQDHPAIHPEGAGSDAQAFIAFLQSRGKLPRQSLVQKVLASFGKN